MPADENALVELKKHEKALKKHRKDLSEWGEKSKDNPYCKELLKDLAGHDASMTDLETAPVCNNFEYSWKYKRHKRLPFSPLPGWQISVGIGQGARAINT